MNGKRMLLGGLLVLLCSIFAITIANAQATIECGLNYNYYDENGAYVQKKCEIYEDDASITGMIIRPVSESTRLGIESDIDTASLVDLTATKLDSYDNTYYELELLPNRSITDPVATLTITYCQLDLVRNNIYVNVTSTSEGHITNVQELAVESNLNTKDFINANMTADSNFENDNTISSDADYIYIKYKFSLTDENVNVWPLAIKGVLKINEMTTSSTLTKLAIESMTIESDTSSNSSNLGSATFNQETGAFIIELNNTFTNLSVRSFVLVVKVANNNQLNLNDIWAQLSRVRYVINTDEDYEKGDLEDTINTLIKVHEPEVIKGDWTGDSVFNLVDLVRYRLYVAGVSSMVQNYDQLGPNRKFIVDLNNDSQVNLSDLAAARRKAVGL